MLLVEEWVNIRELARQGLSATEIARRTGRDRKTVRKILKEAGPKPRVSGAKARVSKLAPFKDYLLGRVEQGCLNGTVLLEEITKLGYTGKVTMLGLFLTPIRQELLRRREATERFETGPGKQAQMDWGYFGTIWDWEQERWRKLYAFLFTLAYSRAQYLAFTTSWDMEHFLDCHLGAFRDLGIPEQILYDNLKTGILGRHEDGTPIFPGRFLDFALYYGFTPKFCQPYRARTKGKVERGIGYVRQNFWVRVAGEVASKQMDLVRLNERAAEWVANVANIRVHGTHGEVVLKRFAEEQPLLGTLIARPRYDTDYHAIRRVGRDGRLSYHGKLYQVQLTHALGEVEVAESLEGKVTIRSKSGQPLPAELIVAGESATQPNQWRLPAKADGRGAELLWLPHRDHPFVETRNLEVYEEVARAASLG